MMKKIKQKEAPQERFQRLATARTNTVLKKLKILGNCSNRYLYDYSKKDVEKIFSTIKRKVRETEAKFTFSKNKRFKL